MLGLDDTELLDLDFDLLDEVVKLLEEEVRLLDDSDEGLELLDRLTEVLLVTELTDEHTAPVTVGRCAGAPLILLP